ncbi:MAG: peptidoglycan-associated lipoprotein Pal [Acidobacteriota bacterium]
MSIDRKWIALALTLMLALAIGCKKDAPQVAPPPAVEPTTTDTTERVEAAPAPGPSTDTQQPQRPATLQLWEQELRRQGLIGDVFYAFDRYDLSAESKQRLAKNAEFLNSSEGQGVMVTIEGHCDERGTNEYNLALGQRRGQAALDYLASLGVDSSRFKTVSYGEERPFCTQSDEACWAQNRRAAFVITAAPGY